MIEVTSFAQTALAFSEAFVMRTRAAGAEYFALREGSPQWMTDAIREAHDDELPNDWRYAKCSELADHISECAADGMTVDEIREETNVSAMEPDVYTSDLLSWYANNVSRLGYADQAAKEWGQSDDIDGQLRDGQAFAINQMFNALLWAIERDVRDRPTDHAPTL